MRTFPNKEVGFILAILALGTVAVLANSEVRLVAVKNHNGALFPSVHLHWSLVIAFTMFIGGVVLASRQRRRDILEGVAALFCFTFIVDLMFVVIATQRPALFGAKMWSEGFLTIYCEDCRVRDLFGFLWWIGLSVFLLMTISSYFLSRRFTA